MDVNCFIKRVLDPNVRTEGVQNSYGLRRVVSLNERDSLRVTLNRGILVPRYIRIEVEKEKDWFERGHDSKP